MPVDVYLAKAVITAGSQNVRPVVDEGDRVYVVVVRVDSKRKLEFHVQKCGRIASKSALLSLRISIFLQKCRHNEHLFA